jgi:hypothetical protein
MLLMLKAAVRRKHLDQRGQPIEETVVMHNSVLVQQVLLEDQALVVILKYPDAYTISNPGGGLTLSTSAPAGGFKVTTVTAGTGNVSFA